MTPFTELQQWPKLKITAVWRIVINAYITPPVNHSEIPNAHFQTLPIS